MQTFKKLVSLSLCWMLMSSMCLFPLAASGITESASGSTDPASGNTDPVASGVTDGIADIRWEDDFEGGTIDGTDDHFTESYNFDSENPGLEVDFIGEGRLKSVTLSNTKDFSAQPEGSITADPNHAGYYLFSIMIDLLHNPYGRSSGDTFTTEVKLTLENGKTATYTYTLEITDDAILAWPIVISDGIEYGWKELFAGKTYEIDTHIVDRAGLLKEEETRVRLVIEDEDKEYVEAVNAVTSNPVSNKLSFKVKKIGSFTPRTILEKKVGENWEEVYDMGWGMGSDKGDETTAIPVDEATLQDALAKVKDGKAELPLSSKNVLTADNFNFLKNNANTVDTVVLKPENENVTLSFNPSKIDTSKLNDKPFTASVRSTRPSEISKITGLTQNKAGSWLDFDFSGTLPAPMTITVKIDPADYPAGIGAEDFRIWYYNETTKQLELKNIPVTYNAESKTVSFTLEHFSAYLILDKNSAPKVVKDPVSPPSGGNSDSEERDWGMRDTRVDNDSSIDKFTEALDELNGKIKNALLLASSKEAKAFAEKAANSRIATANVKVKIGGKDEVVTVPVLRLKISGLNYLTIKQVDQLRKLNAVVMVDHDGKTHVFNTWNIKPAEANRVWYPFSYLASNYAVEVVK